MSWKENINQKSKYQVVEPYCMKGTNANELEYSNFKLGDSKF
jgi:hypothetical protein